VKRIPALYSTLILIAPLLIIAALIMAGPLGCGSGGGGGPTPVPTQGAVEIGFVASPSPAATPGGIFQAISLNIVSVRLNPSTDAAVPDTDPNWVAITAPPGTGSFSTSELSVNLVDFQNNAQVFNTGQITGQTYNQIEVIVDPNFPGTVIPSCTSGAQEGCVSYPLKFTASTNVRTTSAFTVTPNALTPLIISINTATLTPPSAPGGNYTLNPTIGVTSSALLAPISGKVTGVASTGEAITAELTGTHSVIATAPVQATGAYTIQVPAATNGTVYDLYVNSTGTTVTSIDATSGVSVTRGVPASENFSVVQNPGIGAVAGAVLTAGHQPIAAATVNLLLPSAGATNCATSPGCVVVGSTVSDSSGNYSLGSVPVASTYFVQAQATGFNTVTQALSFPSAIAACTAGPNSANCSFLLGNTQITGTVTVDPPPAAGTNTVVLVMAEEHGTGNLVGLGQTVALPGTGTAPFSVEVPTDIPSFDLIAAAQDTYLGVGTPFPGHTLGVAANVTSTTPGIALTVGCVGHGSINGVATSPDAGTHVRLFQTAVPGTSLVQLMDTAVGQVGSSSATQYSFCAPPGNNYMVQRFEETAATAVPVGTATPVSVPTPAPIATATACPLCQNAAGQCPGNCLSAAPLPLQP
jgi:hypothetical protein